MKKIYVNEICTCGGFNIFKRFCEENNISYINDITEDHLKQYQRIKGVGRLKYTIVVDKLQAIRSKE